MLERDRVRALETSDALQRRNAVRLEERCNSARHLLDDRRLPFVRDAEIEARLTRDDTELRVDLAGGVERVRRLRPGLRRDAADPQARAAELGLLLDADDSCPQLCCPDGRCVPRRTAAKDGNIAFHCSGTLSPRTAGDPSQVTPCHLSVAMVRARGAS